MKNIHKIIRIVSLALILSAGLVHFTYQNAYACTDDSYGGIWNPDTRWCDNVEPMVDCYVCYGEPEDPE